MSKLVDAARRGDIRTLQELAADKETDINQTEPKTGFTALHAATVWGNTATVHWLLSTTQIDSNIRDKVGRRAIDIATSCGQQDSIISLMEATFPRLFAFDNVQKRTNLHVPFEKIESRAADRNDERGR